MSLVSVRKSGGANIVSIPKAIVQLLGLEVGSKLDLSIEDERMVLTPVVEDLSIEDLLAGSPKKCFEVTKEDRQWLDLAPSGKEV